MGAPIPVLTFLSRLLSRRGPEHAYRPIILEAPTRACVCGGIISGSPVRCPSCDVTLKSYHLDTWHRIRERPRAARSEGTTDMQSSTPYFEPVGSFPGAFLEPSTHSDPSPDAGIVGGGGAFDGGGGTGSFE